MLGRVNENVPVKSCSIAAPWSTPSPTIERIMHRSSTRPPMCGNRSLTSMPLWPYFLKAHGDFMSPPAFSSLNVSERSNGTAFPLSRLRRGFGSKVSTCEGPPCMNRKITRLARGAKCVCFGASGPLGRDADRRLSPANSAARPTLPNPQAVWRSNARREIS